MKHYLLTQNILTLGALSTQTKTMKRIFINSIIFTGMAFTTQALACDEHPNAGVGHNHELMSWMIDNESSVDVLNSSRNNLKARQKRAEQRKAKKKVKNARLAHVSKHN